MECDGHPHRPAAGLGRIVEGWEQLDMLGMWQQLGVVTLPGHGP
jgi:hypothetical protein